MSTVSGVAAVLVLLNGAGSPAPGARTATAPAAGSTVGLPTGGDPVVEYRSPVSGPLRIVEPFSAPSTPYGPGHRGVDIASAPDGPVRAAAAGIVEFAGSVAGRGLVVIGHADGVRTEYEPVRPSVRVGQSVRAGQVIATVSGTHRTCPPDRCLHWGARRGNAYFDPLTLLNRLGPVVLLPWPATSSR